MYTPYVSDWGFPWLLNLFRTNEISKKPEPHQKKEKEKKEI
jgi:hypothetical protein